MRGGIPTRLGFAPEWNGIRSCRSGTTAAVRQGTPTAGAPPRAGGQDELSFPARLIRNDMELPNWYLLQGQESAICVVPHERHLPGECFLIDLVPRETGLSRRGRYFGFSPPCSSKAQALVHGVTRARSSWCLMSCFISMPEGLTNWEVSRHGKHRG